MYGSRSVLNKYICVSLPPLSLVLIFIVMANHRFTLLLRRRRRFCGGDIRFRSRSRSRHSLTARFQIRAEFRRAFHVVRTHGRSGGAHETVTREFRSSRQAPHGGLRRNRQVGVGALRNGRDCGSREQSQGGSAINLFFRLGGDDSLDLRSSRRLRLLHLRRRRRRRRKTREYFCSEKEQKKRKKNRERKRAKKKEEREIFTPIRPYLGEENETKKINAQAKSLSLSLSLSLSELSELSELSFLGSNALSMSPSSAVRTRHPL